MTDNFACDVERSPQRYKLREGVAIVDRGPYVIITDPAAGRAIRLSRSLYCLCTLLQEGASREEIQTLFAAMYPESTGLRARQDEILTSIAGAGLMCHQKGEGERRQGRRWVLGPGFVAPRRIAVAIGALPSSAMWLFLGVLLAAASAGVAEAFMLHHVPSLRSYGGVSAFGVVCYLLVFVPLHELAHAVVCELAGTRTGSIGILFRSGFFPTPFVDTSRAYLIASLWTRLWIPAAGPTVDFLGLGVAAWLLCLGNWAECHPGLAPTLFTLSMIFFYMNSSPLISSDGSRMLATLVNDDMARQNAFRSCPSLASTSRMRLIYRAACCSHVFLGGAILYAWWTYRCR